MGLINYPSSMLLKLSLGSLQQAAGSISQAVGALCPRYQGSEANGTASTSRSVSTDSVEESDLQHESYPTKVAMKYMSRGRNTSPQAPFQRKPIYFPHISLEMMKLDDAALKQIDETGWTREVVFKTTPNVTKLEIKAFLENVYGMKVEKVNTINYLGKKYTTFGRQKIPKKYIWREADWKKAYVLFSRPKGLEEQAPPLLQPGQPMDMIDQLRVARGLGPRPARGRSESAEPMSMIDQ